MIITILVLIVLTGVVIATLIGNESIIDNANSAVEKYNSKVNEEKDLLEQISIMLKNGTDQVDWEQAKANATKPADQTQSDYLGLDSNGDIVNMDNWANVLFYNNNKCELGGYETIGSTEIFVRGYTGEITAEGKIIGNVPQWVYNSTKEEWYEVIGFSLKGLTALKIAPEIPGSVTNLNETFAFCTNLIASPVIPNSVKNMESTFEGCKSLKEAPVLPNGLISLDSAFSDCTSLEEAPVIPNGVTDISHAFSGCTKLKEAPVIPSSVKYMWGAFSDCDSLVTAPAIPEGVTSLRSTFFSCDNLKTAPAIPSSVTNMWDTFAYCTSLETAPVIPSNVVNIYGAFRECKNLKGEVRVLSDKISNTPSEYGYCFNGAATAEGTNLVVKAKNQTVLNRLEQYLDGNEHITFELLSE